MIGHSISRRVARRIGWTAWTCVVASGLLLAGRHPSHAQVTIVDPAQAESKAGPSAEVGLDEKLGQTIPSDLVFHDHRGVQHTMGELLDRPTILVLVYYHCPSACGLIQGSVAADIASIPFKLGRDYQILSVSFDDEETPELASETRSNYTAIVKGNVPEDAWRFMTGDLANIQKLCTAVGFRVKKLGHHNYVHPNLITILSADGKVIRYLYGSDFLPLDIGMALTEASRGTPGVSIKKLLSFCFAFDPKSHRYTFSVFRIFGATTLLFSGGFLFFLLRKQKEEPEDKPAP